MSGRGYTSAEKCVRAFYEKAGGDWLERSFTGAWQCVSPAFVTTGLGQDAALVTCQLEVYGREVLEQGTIAYGSIEVPQQQLAVRAGKYWHLASAHLNMPSSGEPTAA